MKEGDPFICRPLASNHVSILGNANILLLHLDISIT